MDNTSKKPKMLNAEIFFANFRFQHIGIDLFQYVGSNKAKSDLVFQFWSWRWKLKALPPVLPLNMIGIKSKPAVWERSALLRWYSSVGCLGHIASFRQQKWKIKLHSWEIWNRQKFFHLPYLIYFPFFQSI